jgi:hypothetical protein
MGYQIVSAGYFSKRSNNMSFGKFFHADNFEGILTPDLAATVAKKADQILSEEAILMFGTVYNDGRAEGFSTSKDPTDSHVALAVGARPMAAFVPSESYIKTDKLGNDDLKTALENRVKVLESQLRQRGDYGG